MPTTTDPTSAFIQGLAREKIASAARGGASREKKEEPSDARKYGRAMVALAPVAAAQALSDIPEGWIESAVESRARKHVGLPDPAQKTSSLRRGLARGGGRLGAALFTTPLFMSGMRDVNNGKTQRERQIGYAKVIGSGTVFAGMKGALEAAGEHAGTGRGGEEVWKKIRNLAGARTLIGAGSGVITAATTTAMLKDQEKDPDNKMNRFVIPAIAGGVLGTGKGAVEHLVEHGSKGFSDEALVKELKGRAAGKMAGGVFAGLVVNELMRKFLPEKKKHAAAGNAGGPSPVLAREDIPIHGPTNPAPGVTLLPNPEVLYDRTLERARTLTDADLFDAYEETLKNDPEGTPTRRALTYAYYDAIKARGKSIPPPPGRKRVLMGNGKEELSQHRKPMYLGYMAGIWAPGLVLREIMKLPDTDRNAILRDGLDRILLEEDAKLNQTTFKSKDLRPNEPLWPVDLGYHIPEDTLGSYVGAPISPKAIQEIAKRHAEIDIIKASTPVETRLDDTYRLSKAEMIERDFLGFLKGKGLNPATNERKIRFMGVSKDVDPSVYAHEIGHAAAGDWRRKTYGSSAFRKLQVKTVPIAMLASFLATMSTATTHFQTPEEAEARVKLLAGIGAATGALHAPVLLEEATASADGLRMLRKAGANTGEMLKGTGKLLVAFASYAMPAAIPLGGAAYLAHEARKMRNAWEEERQAARAHLSVAQPTRKKDGEKR